MIEQKYNCVYIDGQYCGNKYCFAELGYCHYKCTLTEKPYYCGIHHNVLQNMTEDEKRSMLEKIAQHKVKRVIKYVKF